MHEAVSMSAGCVQHIRGDSKHLSVLWGKWQLRNDTLG